MIRGTARLTAHFLSVIEAEFFEKILSNEAA